MARLLIVHQCPKFFASIPHKILINKQFVGCQTSQTVAVELPAGSYLVTIQSFFPFLYAELSVSITDDSDHILTFSDREKWWDMLFAVDLCLWIATFFFNFPKPWDLIYNIVTNGYFALWILYEWLIRKKYFRLHFVTTKKS